MAATMSDVESLLHRERFPYIRVGYGPQPILLIPGAEAGDGEQGWLTRQGMRAAFGRFARDYSLFIVHRRRGLPAHSSTADLAADYVAVLHSMARDGMRAHLIGFSTGGLIAQHLAAQEPASVDRLVLAVTGVRLSEQGRSLVQHWRGLAVAGRWVELNTAMSEVMLPEGASRLLLRAFMSVAGWLMVRPPRHPDDFVITMDADLAHDASAVLPRLAMPTLVLGGECDPFFPAPLLAETAAAIPNAVLKVYAGAGHGLPKLHKRRFEDDVLAFLSPVAAPAAAH